MKDFLLFSPFQINLLEEIEEQYNEMPLIELLEEENMMRTYLSHAKQDLFQRRMMNMLLRSIKKKER